MKWAYKVVTIDELFTEHRDHDIAVSIQAAASRRTKMGHNVEEALNKLGSEGWELVSIYGEYGIFKKLVAHSAS